MLINIPELENSVKLVDPQKDALYNYSSSEQKAINNAHPWRTDPNYFTSVRISAIALLKMVMHARSGGSIEVMGLMLGKIEAHTFVVTDAFRLPVEGTETRVNAQDEANEYMVEFLQRAREQGQMLALGHRRQHTEDSTTVPRPLLRHRHRSRPNCLCGQSRDRCLPYLFNRVRRESGQGRWRLQKHKWR